MSLPGEILREVRASQKSASCKWKVCKNKKTNSLQDPSCISSVSNAALGQRHGAPQKQMLRLSHSIWSSRYFMSEPANLMFMAMIRSPMLRVCRDAADPAHHRGEDLGTENEAVGLNGGRITAPSHGLLKAEICLPYRH